MPAVIDAEPEDNVTTYCLLTLKLVSVKPAFEVVFKVLILLYGNLNIEIFLLDPCIFALFLVATVFVETSEAPTVVPNSKILLDVIDSIVLSIVVPASVVNAILSPILNSVLNNVPNPVTVEPLFATDIEPNTG